MMLGDTIGLQNKNNGLGTRSQVTIKLVLQSKERSAVALILHRKLKREKQTDLVLQAEINTKLCKILVNVLRDFAYRNSATLTFLFCSEVYGRGYKMIEVC